MNNPLSFMLICEEVKKHMLAEFSGKKLRDARKKKNISQEVLAEQADLGDRYIRELESGRKSNPSAVLVYRMANTLEISMEELMDSSSETSSAE